MGKLALARPEIADHIEPRSLRQAEIHDGGIDCDREPGKLQACLAIRRQLGH